MEKQDLGTVLRLFAAIASSMEHGESAVVSDGPGTGHFSERRPPYQDVEALVPSAAAQE